MVVKDIVHGPRFGCDVGHLQKSLQIETNQLEGNGDYTKSRKIRSERMVKTHTYIHQYTKNNGWHGDRADFEQVGRIPKVR